jgi:signal transduction histidine kinase/CheY-like chemotaxis protein
VRSFPLDLVERLAPYFVCWDKATGAAYVSAKLAALWGLECPSDLPPSRIRIVRPTVGELRFEWLAELTDLIVHVTTEDRPTAIVRGQFLEDDGQWIFVGSPYVFSIEELHRIGLQIGDLALHDNTGDLLIAAETTQAAFQQTRDKAQELHALNEELAGANHILSSVVPAELRETLGLEPADAGPLSQRVVLVGRIIESLQASVEFRERFLATMSHELRTPLNAILGLSEALMEGVYGELENRQVKSLETIFTSGEHLLSLINDVLEMSKFEAGEAVLNRSETTAARLCETSMRMLTPLAQKKGLEFAFEDETEGVAFTCDVRRIRQVLVNLLGNALKFTETGRVSLSVATIADTGRIEFRVQDTGIGIGSDDQQKLFAPFYQVQQTLNREYQGTGLGLAIAKHTVELHDGRMLVTSVLGEGSSFSFQIPAALQQGETGHPAPRSLAEEPDSTQRQTPTARRQGGRLLVLTGPDTEEIALLDYLRAEGIELLVSREPLQALKTLLEEPVHAVLTHSELRGMTGIDFVGCVRALRLGHEVPLIMSASPSHDDNDEHQFRAAGVDQYVCRPYRLAELVELILGILGESRRGDTGELE